MDNPQHNAPRTPEEYRAWYAANKPDGVAWGRCWCSPECGAPTNVAPNTDQRRLWFKGEPLRYARGHAGYNKGRPEYVVDPQTNCWVWQRAKHAERGRYGSYGAYYEDGNYRLAHVVFYEHYIGPIPTGTELDHLCRNPLCVFHKHLEPVPHYINTQRGDVAKLTADDVRHVRNLYASGNYTQTALARLLGLRQDHISDIVRRMTWKNV